MENFWHKLKKPIICLAPMADVTDAAFRQIIAKYGKPMVFWTEFVSADGLCSPGREKLLIDFIYSQDEHPIVAQIFGGKPENIREASALCRELGFDGIDINMGCPDRAVEKQCAGAGMIKDPKLARDVIRAAIEGAGGLPVSVKTRLGYNKVDMGWIRALLEEDIAVLTVHLRTRKEMSLVPAHWELMQEIVDIRDELGTKTLIIGNGDVSSVTDAREKCSKYGCDGAMLGRAIFGNPFLFSNKNVLSTVEGQGLPNSGSDAVSVSQRLSVLVEHTELFEKLLGTHKNFAIMKKHYKAYAHGFDGAKELRIELMEANSPEDVERTVRDFLAKMS